MSKQDRFQYLTATVLDQDLLNETADNLTNQLEMVCDIEAPVAFVPSGFIRASDRNKYVDGIFYEAMLNFPTVRRTVGEWLSPIVEFSTLDIELTNVDGRFNSILPGGSDFGGFIGNSIEVRLGLRNVGSTYTTIFSGFITDVSGFGRTVKSIRMTARDKFDQLNVGFPGSAFTKLTYPFIEDQVAGKFIPVVYGDFTTNVNPQAASVFAFQVNGADPDVDGTTNTNNLDLVISENDNVSFDTSQVYLFRSSTYYKFSAIDVVNVTANRRFELVQDTVNTQVDGSNWLYESGDTFLVKIKGKDLGAFDDNIVSIARDILETYGGLLLADFNDTNWDSFRDKAAPAESSISTFKARAWVQDQQTVMEFVLSLFEQVRLEIFVNRGLALEITSLHFEDFVASPTFEVKNWDVVRESLDIKVDIRNNINRAKGQFNFLPDTNTNFSETSLYRNQDAINQIKGKEIGKRFVFPNLYELATVNLQVIEMLKLSSSYLEIVDVELTWRALLLDVGDFVKLKISIGATIFNDVPCLIRSIGYDPQGVKIPMQLFSFQMVPFPGHAPGFSGITGGSTATIIEET